MTDAARPPRHPDQAGDSPLPGGAVTEVARVGPAVRRRPGPGADFVHALLRFLERRGWTGAPRLLGMDQDGREILTFLEGHVAWQAEQPPAISSDRSLVRAAELVREFHDLTAGSELAGSAQVVCHNDLAPNNTVYRDLGDGLVPVAFIDWDLAGPGARIHDVAHVCWQYLGLGPACPSPGAAGRRINLICGAYGLADRAPLIETVLWWQDRCWRGIAAGAANGDPAMARLVAGGAVTEIQAAYRWTARHRAALERAAR